MEFMEHKKVSVLIVNTNTKDVMKLCLENLKDSYENLEVVVADNASSDGSAEMVETEFPWVKLLRLPNYGLAFALNKCLEVATGEYYLYLGTDGFPKEGAIKGLVEYFEAPEHADVGAAAVKLVLRSGIQDMDGHRGFPTPFVSMTHFLGLDKMFPKSKTFAGYFMTYEDLDKEHEIDTCITHFLFVSGKATQKVGKWDEETFFLYGEDIDYCYRIKKAGFKLMYLPQFRAEHWKGVTIGIRKETQDVAMRVPIVKFRDQEVTLGKFRVELQKLSTNAMELFYRKHYFKKYPLIVSMFVIATTRILKVYRMNKQRYVNWRKGIK